MVKDIPKLTKDIYIYIYLYTYIYIYIYIKLLFGNPTANFGPLRGQPNSSVANKEIKLGRTFASVASTNRTGDFVGFV